MTNEAFRVAPHRMRRRYRLLLEAEILETITNPAELTDEIQHLMQALA